MSAPPSGSPAPARPTSHLLPGTGGLVTIPVDFRQHFPEPTATAVEALRVGDDYPDPSRPERVSAWHQTVGSEIHSRLLRLARLAREDLTGYDREERERILSCARELAWRVEDYLEGYQRIYGREARIAFCASYFRGYGPAVEITADGKVPVRLKSTGDLFAQAEASSNGGQQASLQKQPARA